MGRNGLDPRGPLLHSKEFHVYTQWETKSNPGFPKSLCGAAWALIHSGGKR